MRDYFAPDAGDHRGDTARRRAVRGSDVSGRGVQPDLAGGEGCRACDSDRVYGALADYGSSSASGVGGVEAVDLVESFWEG